MPYCTIADVRTALNGDGASSGSNTAADLPDIALTDAVNEASAVVDSYIGGPYISSELIPPVILYWSRNIAVYLATLTWRKSMDIKATDPVAIRYQNALTMLNMVKTGELAFPMPLDVLDVATIASPFGQSRPLFNERQFDLRGRDDLAWCFDFKDYITFIDRRTWP